MPMRKCLHVPQHLSQSSTVNTGTLKSRRTRAAQGNSQLSQKMMRARVMAQVCCQKCNTSGRHTSK